MSKWIVPLSAAGGFLAGFFFDPVSGRTRRAKLGQRVPAFLRRRGRELGRIGRRAGAGAYGVTQKAQHLRRTPKPDAFNDPALARKVETEIFRDPDVPKGRINVMAHDGVVELRGEVDSAELIEELVERARSVPEVREVENLLHLPGEPVPSAGG